MLPCLQPTSPQGQRQGAGEAWQLVMVEWRRWHCGIGNVAGSGLQGNGAWPGGWVFSWHILKSLTLVQGWGARAHMECPCITSLPVLRYRVLEISTSSCSTSGPQSVSLASCQLCPSSTLPVCFAL